VKFEFSFHSVKNHDLIHPPPGFEQTGWNADLSPDPPLQNGSLYHGSAARLKFLIITFFYLKQCGAP